MFIHTLPLIFALVNLFVLSDTIMYMQDIWGMLLVTTAWIIQNYIYTKHTDKAVYGFLKWDDGDNSMVVVTGVSIITAIFEIAFSLLT